MRQILIVLAAAVLGIQGAWAADAAASAAAAAPPPPKPATNTADAEARLAAARQRLEQAAHEVAELSRELAVETRDRVSEFRFETRRAIIGLQLETASGTDGARVSGVSPGGPAAEAGVQTGDVIVAVNGVKVSGANTARQVVADMRNVAPDSIVKLRVLRSGRTRDIEVRTRPVYAFSFPGPYGPAEVHVNPPPFPESWPDLQFMRALSDETQGMELTALTPALGHYFGIDRGVLVVRAPTSDAFRLKDGDVIVAIDGREPRDGSHATRILRSYQPGEKIALKLMRDHKPLTIDVTLPEPATRGRAALPPAPPAPAAVPATPMPPAPPAAPAAPAPPAADDDATRA